MSRAYPRECGGTLFPLDEAIRVAGLSPRVRGNPADKPQDIYKRGPIPASAGEPTMLALPFRVCRAYPRECGGTVPGSKAPVTGRGLSPRVRGNQTTRISNWPIPGPIPASAGEPLP